MSDLKVMEFSRIREDVEAKQERIEALMLYIKVAKIVRFCLALDLLLTIGTYDGRNLPFVLFFCLLLGMCAITAHIFTLAFVEEIEELEGVWHPWNRG